MALKITNNELELMHLFERITGAHANSVYATREAIAFIMPPEALALFSCNSAGTRLRARLRQRLKKEIYLIPDLKAQELFVRAAFTPARIEGIETRDENGCVALLIKPVREDLGLAIGKRGVRAKIVKELLKQRYGYDEVRIV